MTDPETVLERPSLDARKALALLEKTYLGAVLLFVEERGRKPFPPEAAALRRSLAKKALDQITETFSSASSTNVEREAMEALAAEALGGAFTEPG